MGALDNKKVEFLDKKHSRKKVAFLRFSGSLKLNLQEYML